MSEHHWTKQNQIRLAKPSCAEVSNPSEVLRFDGKWIFRGFGKLS